MPRIPKILHQTHKTGELPVSCQGYVERLKRLHPGWAYHFYDDEACGRLITNEMPTLLPLYRQPDLLPVQRADIFRLVVVYLRGGFYLDIDMDMHRALDDLLDFGAVFPMELVLTEEIGFSQSVK
uniref:Glycosyltransferase sugar-binding region containing DXD motif-containing protein n=1 Tax=Candidatus Kentrum sp. DK TaxID=2126562 RepID=A0A450SQ13_9GAMM|nr:MAG: Glycosyltransferase sugar-binding region containing DXD motif-containing protein [Candidatus Kentron sp. DK]